MFLYVTLKDRFALIIILLKMVCFFIVQEAIIYFRLNLDLSCEQ